MTFKMSYSLTQRLWRYLFIGFCTLVFTYLIAPILVIIPLSFNEDPFFSYPITRFSLRWYNDIFGSDPQAILWQRAFVNSAFIGISSTVIATVLGTAAALGLNRTAVAFRSSIVALMISPMIIPVIIAAIGMFYFYAQIGLVGTFTGIILAHASLGVPFVLITVSATLVGLDGNLVRAGASLGASPFRVFRKVTLPLILPGVASGGLFAFVTSWDEVVVTLFLSGAEQHTIPRRMWSGVRDNLSPTIIAVATMLIVLSMALMLSAEWLRGRSERLRLGGS